MKIRRGRALIVGMACLARRNLSKEEKALFIYLKVDRCASTTNWRSETDNNAHAYLRIYIGIGYKYTCNVQHQSACAAPEWCTRQKNERKKKDTEGLRLITARTFASSESLLSMMLGRVAMYTYIRVSTRTGSENYELYERI